MPLDLALIGICWLRIIVVFLAFIGLSTAAFAQILAASALRRAAHAQDGGLPPRAESG